MKLSKEEVDLDWFIERFMVIINYKNNNIKETEDLRKYIYINNFKEEEYIRIKKLFNLFGENKILDCMIKFRNKNINITNKNTIKNCILEKG